MTKETRKKLLQCPFGAAMLREYEERQRRKMDRIGLALFLVVAAGLLVALFVG